MKALLYKIAYKTRVLAEPFRRVFVSKRMHVFELGNGTVSIACVHDQFKDREGLIFNPVSEPGEIGKDVSEDQIGHVMNKNTTLIMFNSKADADRLIARIQGMYK